jgi:histidine ammonia-lyase
LFLARNQGLNTGLMMTQYTAAALVSESKTLAHPASVDSIPVSAGQEDFVSMGGWAVSKAREICTNTEYVIAIEILCAAQALDFHEPLPGKIIRFAPFGVDLKVPSPGHSLQGIQKKIQEHPHHLLRIQV